jgi:hypothetical protein
LSSSDEHGDTEIQKISWESSYTQMTLTNYTLISKMIKLFLTWYHLRMNHLMHLGGNDISTYVIQMDISFHLLNR